MDEAEKVLFQEIADHYGTHDVVRSLNDVLQNAQSMARRLQTAGGSAEGIDDERHAELIAHELGNRLDMYASEYLAELTDSTIVTRPSAVVGSPVPQVTIMSEDESGAVCTEGILLESEASAVGTYVGLDFEVRRTADGYMVQPMIILEAPSVNYADRDSPVFSDEACMMIPLDCERYIYTAIHDSGASKQEAERPNETPYEVDLAELLQVCLDLEKELNWGEFSQDTYDECYGRLQNYLEEHGLVQDREITVAMFAGSLSPDGEASAFINARVIIEKPSITRKDELWYVQLQFSLWQDAKNTYELYGTSPRSILSIEP